MALIAEPARQGQALPLAKRRRCRDNGARAATATFLHHRKNGDGAVRTGGMRLRTMPGGLKDMIPVIGFGMTYKLLKKNYISACRGFYGGQDWGMAEIEVTSDFEAEWIYAEYEAGRAVCEIATELGRSESYIYARMRRRPEKYEDVKLVREENHNGRIRRIRGLADRLILDYLEGLGSSEDGAGNEIDRVNRIAKDYAHRVQLAEGKATENVGVGGMPFNVVITKTYEKETTDGADCTDGVTDESYEDK